MSDIKVHQDPDYQCNEQDPAFYLLDKKVTKELRKSLIQYEKEEKDKKEQEV